MLRLTDILIQERVLVDTRGSEIADKASILSALAGLLAPASGTDCAALERLLDEREQLRSTGIGDGVAIPHCFVESSEEQRAALLLCPKGVPFDAIDGKPVNIIIGVVGPKRATEHLRVLARVSRVLHDRAVRASLLEAATPAQAFELIRERDEGLP